MKSPTIGHDDCIGFFMETSFHYEVYRPIIPYLLKNKIRCELIINDLIEPTFVNEMLVALAKIKVSGLDCALLSVALKTSQEYSCLITPYYIEYINKLSKKHIRTVYGLAKNRWNHAPWNELYDAILCYSNYTKNSIVSNENVRVVGNPRFDDWHTNNYKKSLPAEIKVDERKKTILYAPTYGELSSITSWAERLGRLSQDYNIITKLHHGTLYKKNEAHALKTAKRHLRTIVSESNTTFALLNQADYVLSDNSGFIFDAINADKKIILLNWEGMDSLLINNRSFSTPDSPEQLVRSHLPVAHDMFDLRQYLSDDYIWQQHTEQLDHIKTMYCDAFHDGLAGQRAAQVIIDTMYQ